MNRRQFLKFGLPLLSAAVVLAYLAPKVAHWVDSQLHHSRQTAEKNRQLPSGAKLLLAEGRVHLSVSPHQERLLLSGGGLNRPLLQGQLLETGPRSWAQLEVRSGRIELGEYAQARFELWNPADPQSPLHIVVHRGDFRVLEEPKAGEVFVIQGGRLSALNRAFVESLQDPAPQRRLEMDPGQEFRSITISSLDDQDSLSEAAEDLAHGEGAEDPEGDIEETSDETLERLGIRSLSNNYIDQVIAQQRRQFQRCQANNLRDNLPARGELVMGIRISPRGQVEEVKVLRNTVGDQTMVNCVSSVMERLRFRSFDGPPIERSYPLNFE